MSIEEQYFKLSHKIIITCKDKNAAKWESKTHSIYKTTKRALINQKYPNLISV